MQEFIVINSTQEQQEAGSQEQQNHYVNWTTNTTKMFIELYEKYKKKVGTMEIRTLDKLFSIIATELNAMGNTRFTASQCKNKWRVLERAYKKYIEDKNKTGRGRKFFEFSEEMDRVFQKKRNVNPLILLDAETITPPEKVRGLINNTCNN